jgi:cold shock CspA family protein
MRLFGTIKSFNPSDGHGSIQPENGAKEIRFSRGAVLWRRSMDPSIAQRLLYEVDSASGQLRAVNLRFLDSERSPQESKVRYVDHG